MAATVSTLLFCGAAGAAQLAGTFPTAAAGLSPLPEALLWTAAVAFLIGTAGLTLVLSLTALAVFTVSQLPESVNPKFDHLHIVARDVNDRLRTAKPKARPA